MEDARPTPDDLAEALQILESILRQPSTREADTRVKRRIRVEMRLASNAGRRLDDSAPHVDARLPNGIRLHAVLPPISPHGTCVSLRIPRHRVFSLDDLVRIGMIPAEGADVLAGLMARRSAFLVSGGTGTGKTTPITGRRRPRSQSSRV